MGPELHVVVFRRGFTPDKEMFVYHIGDKISKRLLGDLKP
jgi:hypothetical protein